MPTCRRASPRRRDSGQRNPGHRGEAPAALHRRRGAWEAATHDVVLHEDWSLEIPHDLEAERIATAFGGYLSCLASVDRAVPAAREWVARAAPRRAAAASARPAGAGPRLRRRGPRASAVGRARDVQLAGGGGTDMRVGIAEAIRLRPAPEVVVVLTHGYTPWPLDPPPGVAVVVGLLGRERAMLTETPPWMVRVECAGDD